MNKTYYNYIDLVKDIKEAKSDTIFKRIIARTPISFR